MTYKTLLLLAFAFCGITATAQQNLEPGLEIMDDNSVIFIGKKVSPEFLATELSTCKKNFPEDLQESVCIALFGRPEVKLMTVFDVKLAPKKSNFIKIIYPLDGRNSRK